MMYGTINIKNAYSYMFFITSQFGRNSCRHFSYTPLENKHQVRNSGGTARLQVGEYETREYDNYILLISRPLIQNNAIISNCVTSRINMHTSWMQVETKNEKLHRAHFWLPFVWPTHPVWSKPTYFAQVIDRCNNLRCLVTPATPTLTFWHRASSI